LILPLTSSFFLGQFPLAPLGSFVSSHASNTRYRRSFSKTLAAVASAMASSSSLMVIVRT